MMMGIMMMMTIIMVMPVDEPVRPSAQLSAKFVRLRSNHRHRRRLTGDCICVYLNVPCYGTYTAVCICLCTIFAGTWEYRRERLIRVPVQVSYLSVTIRIAGDFLEVASTRSEVVYAGKWARYVSLTKPLLRGTNRSNGLSTKRTVSYAVVGTSEVQEEDLCSLRHACLMRIALSDIEIRIIDMHGATRSSDFFILLIKEMNKSALGA